jgi:hypothetical protein
VYVADQIGLAGVRGGLLLSRGSQSCLMLQLSLPRERKLLGSQVYYVYVAERTVFGF